MKVKGSILLSVCLIAVSVLISACRNPSDVNDDIQKSAKSESLAFAELKLKQDQMGDSVYKSYSSWVQSLQRLSKYSTEMVDLWNKADSAKRQQYQADVTSLKPLLDEVLQRNDSITLNIPEWSYGDALAEKNEAEVWTTAIANAYTALYGQTASTSKLNIQLQKDTRLADTYGACAALFANYRDTNCQAGALKGCTHQTNIDCVKKMISNHSDYTGNLSCTERVAMASDLGDKSSPKYEDVIATWMARELNLCESSTPILK